MPARSAGTSITETCTPARSRCATATRTIPIHGSGAAASFRDRTRANNQDGTAATFDEARADFEQAWTLFLSKRTEAETKKIYPAVPEAHPPHGRTRAEGEEMTEQEELIQEIRERPGEMPKRALPFDLLAFATTIGEHYSTTQNEIIRLVMNEAEALGVNYLIGSSPG